MNTSQLIEKKYGCIFMADKGLTTLKLKKKEKENQKHESTQAYVKYPERKVYKEQEIMIPKLLIY